eukprot:scaffold44546_cov34-Prasinocladus_malaysianus.AAC.2
MDRRTDNTALFCLGCHKTAASWYALRGKRRLIKGRHQPDLRFVLHFSISTDPNIRALVYREALDSSVCHLFRTSLLALTLSLGPCFDLKT